MDHAPRAPVYLLTDRYLCEMTLLSRCTRAIAAAAVLLPLAACATTGPAQAPALSSCTTGDDATPERVLVAAAGGVRTSAPAEPATFAERFIFRHLYETPVRIDCTGAPVPGLATTWRTIDEGRTWEFVLRGDATFHDGGAVTARDAAAAWRRNFSAAGLIARIDAPDAHTLRVELNVPVRDVRVFADPRFGVMRERQRDAWPAGSGPYRMGEGAERGSVRLVRAGTVRGPAMLDVLHTGGDDARAALDRGADILVRADPASVGYARVLSGYEADARVADRTLALVVRAAEDARATTAPADARVFDTPGARPPRPPFWWDDGQCRARIGLLRDGGSATAPPTADRDPFTIAYRRGDAAARDVAERIAALAWPVSRTPGWLDAVLPRDRGAARTLPLDDATLAAAVRDAGAAAFVLSMPRPADGECPVAAALQPATEALVADGMAGWRIVPLVDADTHVVWRRGSGRFTLDGDGIPVFGTGSR